MMNNRVGGVRLYQFALRTFGAFGFLLLLGVAGMVSAWTGPTGTAPANNVLPPINIGTTNQVKNGGLSVNALSVFGNSILSGTGTGRYLNFDYNAAAGSGINGYGIRDNAGVLEFKNAGGTGGTSGWKPLPTIISETIALSGGQWVSNGTSIYYNAGNVGIGTTNPLGKLQMGELVFNPAWPGMYFNAYWDNASAGHKFVIADSATIIQQDYSTDGLSIFTSPGGTAGATFWQAGASLAMFIKGTGNVGIGNNTPAQKLDVTGTVRANAFVYSSDARMKQDVTALKSGLAKTMQLRPVSFVWKEGSQKGAKDIGFIAQDVEKVVPEVVHTGVDGMKAVDYPKLVPILVKAIQDQQDEIDTLKNQVQQLQDAQ